MSGRKGTLAKRGPLKKEVDEKRVWGKEAAPGKPRMRKIPSQGRDSVVKKVVGSRVGKRS